MVTEDQVALQGLGQTRASATLQKPKREGSPPVGQVPDGCSPPVATAVPASKSAYIGGFSSGRPVTQSSVPEQPQGRLQTESCKVVLKSVFHKSALHRERGLK